MDPPWCELLAPEQGSHSSSIVATVCSTVFHNLASATSCWNWFLPSFHYSCKQASQLHLAVAAGCFWAAMDPQQASLSLLHLAVVAGDFLAELTR